MKTFKTLEVFICQLSLFCLILQKNWTKINMNEKLWIIVKKKIIENDQWCLWFQNYFKLFFLNYVRFHEWFYGQQLLTIKGGSRELEFFFRERLFSDISSRHKALFFFIAPFKAYGIFPKALNARDKDNLLGKP